LINKTEDSLNDNYSGIKKDIYKTLLYLAFLSGTKRIKEKD
jgi:hypothetical protein